MFILAREIHGWRWECDSSVKDMDFASVYFAVLLILFVLHAYVYYGYFPLKLFNGQPFDLYYQPSLNPTERVGWLFATLL